LVWLGTRGRPIQKSASIQKNELTYALNLHLLIIESEENFFQKYILSNSVSVAFYLTGNPFFVKKIGRLG